jgi:hypothetical protein
MSLNYQRISAATSTDVIFYDPAAERRAASLRVSWDDYFVRSSQDILYKLEFSWWPQYVQQTLGSYLYATDAAGRLVTAFDPARILTNSQIMIQLEVFKAVEIFYSTLVTDVSNINQVDLENYKFARQRFQSCWDEAQQLSNFYDRSGDGEVSKLEENYNMDMEYLSGDRRYF